MQQNMQNMPNCLCVPVTFDTSCIIYYLMHFGMSQEVNLLSYFIWR